MSKPIPGGGLRAEPAGSGGRAQPAGSGDRAQPEVVGSQKLPAQRGSRLMRDRAVDIQRRRRAAAVLLLVGVLLLVSGGAWFWWQQSSKVKPPPPPPDFAGPPGTELVVHVRDGEATWQIADDLVAKKIVKSKEAFLEAALSNPKPGGVHPGYYVLQTNLPAAQAIAQITSPDRMAGFLSVNGSSTLDGTKPTPDHPGDPVRGIYEKIAEASCLTVNGQKHCVSVEDLRQTAQNATLEELGLPGWAKEAVTGFPEGVPRDRRLEGLIVGVWNFDPQADPLTILRTLITNTTGEYQEIGLVDGAKALGWTPYQALVGASLIEREVNKPDDLAKVARVILNRMADGEPLAFDSAINYVLSEQEIGTSDEDRRNPTLWNTYTHKGLTPAPICSPSYAAIRAMLKPADGPWRYFVTINKDGTTAFSETYDEHLKNVKLAEENGVILHAN